MWTEINNQDKIVMHMQAGECCHSIMCDEVVIHQLDEPISDVAYSVIQINNQSIKITLSLYTIKFNQLPPSLLKLVDKVHSKSTNTTYEKQISWEELK